MVTQKERRDYAIISIIVNLYDLCLLWNNWRCLTEYLFFNSMKVKGDLCCLDSNVLESIFWVSQMKRHTGFEQCGGEYIVVICGLTIPLTVFFSSVTIAQLLSK